MLSSECRHGAPEAHVSFAETNPSAAVDLVHYFSLAKEYELMIILEVF